MGARKKALNPNENFNFVEYYNSRPIAERLPVAIQIDDRRLSRYYFIAENFPTQQDSDILSFRYLVCGLTISKSEVNTNEDPRIQKSFRSLVFDSLKSYSTGKSRVGYVDVSRCNANNHIEMMERLEKIEIYYNPKEKRKFAHEYIYVAMHCDQLLFKLLFSLWFKSHKDWLRGGAQKEVDSSADNLCRWIIPLLWEFRTDKQGLIPLIKEYLCGSGLE